jgi:MoaA/NifB/PqqE/SkfB family radical SAM enzyme
MNRQKLFHYMHSVIHSRVARATVPVAHDLLRLAREFVKGGLPGQVIVQVTTACEATCEQCAYGRAGAPKKTLPEEKVLGIIDTAAANGFQAISFTGGEPFLLYRRLLRYIQHAGEASIKFIRTGTNAGFLQRPYRRFGNTPQFRDAVSRIADDIASAPLRNLWISVDSTDVETHEANRGLKGVIRAIALSIPIFAERSIFPAINLGINRLIDGPCPEWEMLGHADTNNFDAQRFEKRYREGFERYFQLCQELGFTIVGVCYPMAEQTGTYGAASETLTSYSREELAMVFKALDEVTRQHRHRLRISSPSTALYYLRKGAFGVPCSGGHDYFFISAVDGLTYPCGYIDKPLGEFKDLDFHKLRKENRTCTRCHWECFYDPDQLVGTVRQLLAHPVSVMPKVMRNPELRDRLIFDMRYFLACDFLDGRRPPNYEKLARFSPP